MDPYRTHLPILERCVKKLGGRLCNVLECGCGMYSTLYLASIADHVISIETESAAWALKVKLASPSNVKMELHVGGNETAIMNNLNGRVYDLILIDGAAAYRRSSAIAAQHMSNVVVCHDAGVPTNYPDMILRDGYTWTEYKDLTPTTAIITNRGDLI